MTLFDRVCSHILVFSPLVWLSPTTRSINHVSSEGVSQARAYQPTCGFCVDYLLQPSRKSPVDRSQILLEPISISTVSPFLALESYNYSPGGCLGRRNISTIHDINLGCRSQMTSRGICVHFGYPGGLLSILKRAAMDQLLDTKTRDHRTNLRSGLVLPGE